MSRAIHHSWLNSDSHWFLVSLELQRPFLAAMALLCVVATSLAAGSASRPVESSGPSSRRTPLAISEIMYAPSPRNDGRSLEFVALYNSQPWFQHRCTRRNR